MSKYLLIMLVAFMFVGCGQDFMSIGSSSASMQKELQRQKSASDAEVEKLEKEIAKYEADKLKYSKDYEKYNNNPILDELDETLKELDEQESGFAQSSDDNKTKKDEE